MLVKLAMKIIEKQRQEKDKQWDLGLDHPHSNLTGKNAEVLARLAKVEKLEECAPVFDVDRKGMQSDDGFYFDTKSLSFKSGKSQMRGNSRARNRTPKK